MSDNAIIVCELSVSAEEAPTRAAAARNWLLDNGFIAPNSAQTILRPSTFVPGPKAIAVAPGFDQEPYRMLAHIGVDFVVERALHDAVENAELPYCPLCHSVAGPEASDLLIEWVVSPEPFLTCSACGTSHLLGDWTGTFHSYVGEVGVYFHNWPSINASFLAELGAILGPRARTVYMHH